MCAAQWITAAKRCSASDGAQQRAVAEVALDQAGFLRRPAVAGVEIVQDHRPMAGIEQVADDEAADVAAAAGHQHRRTHDHRSQLPECWISGVLAKDSSRLPTPKEHVAMTAVSATAHARPRRTLPPPSFVSASRSTRAATSSSRSWSPSKVSRRTDIPAQQLLDANRVVVRRQHGCLV